MGLAGVVDRKKGWNTDRNARIKAAVSPLQRTARLRREEVEDILLLPARSLIFTLALTEVCTHLHAEVGRHALQPRRLVRAHRLRSRGKASKVGECVIIHARRDGCTLYGKCEVRERKMELQLIDASHPTPGTCRNNSHVCVITTGDARLERALAGCAYGMPPGSIDETRVAPKPLPENS